MIVELNCSSDLLFPSVYLQDEKIEYCRFSRDGAKPFLFCTLVKGNPLNEFKEVHQQAAIVQFLSLK